MILGALAALSAALAWAVAAVWFERVGRHVRPMELNLLKGLGAILLMTLTLLVLGDSLAALPGWALGLLLLSGALGIGLGDSAYFAALRRVGVRRALLLGTLAPPLTALLGLFLGERLALSAWLGILLTSAGVAWVITERTAGQDGRERQPWAGIGFGFFAALAQAGGAVLSRLVFLQTTVSPLQSALLRLAAGVSLLLVLLLVQRQRVLGWRQLPQARQLAGWLALAVLIGTFLAIWLQQISFKLAPTAIAQTLLATSPLFGLPIAWRMGERLSSRSVWGVLLALAGVALLFVGPV